MKRNIRLTVIALLFPVISTIIANSIDIKASHIAMLVIGYAYGFIIPVLHELSENICKKRNCSRSTNFFLFMSSCLVAFTILALAKLVIGIILSLDIPFGFGTPYMETTGIFIISSIIGVKVLVVTFHNPNYRKKTEEV